MALTVLSLAKASPVVVHVVVSSSDRLSWLYLHGTGQVIHICPSTHGTSLSVSQIFSLSNKWIWLSESNNNLFISDWIPLPAICCRTEDAVVLVWTLYQGWRGIVSIASAFLRLLYLFRIKLSSKRTTAVHVFNHKFLNYIIKFLLHCFHLNGTMINLCNISKDHLLILAPAMYQEQCF